MAVPITKNLGHMISPGIYQPEIDKEKVYLEECVYNSIESALISITIQQYLTSIIFESSKVYTVKKIKTELQAYLDKYLNIDTTVKNVKNDKKLGEVTGAVYRVSEDGKTIVTNFVIMPGHSASGAHPFMPVKKK